MDRKALLLVTFLVEGGLLLIGLVLLGKVESKFQYSWKATVYALLLCIPMLVAFFVVIGSQWEPLSRLNTEINEKILPIFTKCELIDLALIAVLAGVGEELFFRGWLQSVMINKIGVCLGILIVSVIFGLVHYLSTSYAIYAFLTGIYFGVIYYASGNLYIVMAIHAVYDFIALVYLVKRGGGQGAGYRTIE